MRILIMTALTLVMGCGSIERAPFVFELRDDFDPAAFDRSADYWRAHGVGIEAGPAGSPFSVRSTPLPDDKGDGVTRLGEILIDPDYLWDHQLLAHEIGHMIGLFHLPGCAVMASPPVCAVDELQPADVAALADVR